VIVPAVKKEVVNESDYLGSAIVSDKVKDRENDPFVLKKLEEAKAFIRENGLNGLPGHKKNKSPAILEFRPTKKPEIFQFRAANLKP